MNKKSKLMLLAVILLYIWSITGVLSNSGLLFMTFYFDETLPAIYKSMSSILNTFGMLILNIILLVSANVISKNKQIGINLLLIYILLAIIPNLINHVIAQHFNVIYLINYIRYFSVVLIFIYLKKLKK